jgi:hypothetical protein
MTTQLKLAYDAGIFEGSPFTLLQGPSKGVGQRAITKYHYDGSQPNAVGLALELIARIKQAGLRLTFSGAPEFFSAEIQTKPYMIIHGSAVSLAPTPDAPKGVSIKYIDLYFSGSWLEEPVCCSQGHYMEKKRAMHWTTNNLPSNECPAGGHDMGPLIVDEERQYRISKKREALEKAEKEKREVWEKAEKKREAISEQAVQIKERALQIEQLSQQIALLKQQLAAYKNQKTRHITPLQNTELVGQQVTTLMQEINTYPNQEARLVDTETRLATSLTYVQIAKNVDKIILIGGGVAKVVGRSLCILPSNNMASQLLKSEAAKNLLRLSFEGIAYRTALFCCVVNGAFAVYRGIKYSQGQQAQGRSTLAELTAFGCSFIPTWWGTFLSLLIDIGLLYKDYKNPSAVEEETQDTTAEQLNQQAEQEAATLDFETAKM